MLQENEIDFLQNELSREAGSDREITQSQSVSGGSINDAYKLETNGGAYFVKRNAADRYPGMFEAEMKGLQLLADHSQLEIPKPILLTEYNGNAYLVMNWLHNSQSEPNADYEFGKKLAAMHRSTSDQFGLDHDNYMGSLPQQNKFCPTWEEFFVTQRLQPQVKSARDAGLLSSGHISRFEQLYAEISNIFPEEPPALIHGDLWGGNFMHTVNGTSVFDPAVAYAHREQDIAMTTLFGGFNESFYEGYNSEHPLESGYSKRLDAANLYPLLVHVNLFGSGYLPQTESILRKFT